MTDQELIQALIDYAKQDDWPIVDSDVLQLVAERMAALARVEAERDALLEYAETQMECEMCKNDPFCPVVNATPENCAVCELNSKCPCHPCKWEWRGAQGEG